MMTQVRQLLACTHSFQGSGNTLISMIDVPPNSLSLDIYYFVFVFARIYSVVYPLYVFLLLQLIFDKGVGKG